MLNQSEIESFLDTLVLSKGSHSPDSGLYCPMEAAAFIAEESWSSNPRRVSPRIASFVRKFSDVLDNETRQLLKPYILKCLDTVVSQDAEEKRAWMATDWLVREYAPIFLRLAGLSEHAEALEKLHRLTSRIDVVGVQYKLGVMLESVRSVPESVARVLSWYYVRDIIRPVTWAAARDSFRDDGRDAIGEVVRDIAWESTKVITNVALVSAVEVLYLSMFRLLDRMIDVK